MPDGWEGDDEADKEEWLGGRLPSWSPLSDVVFVVLLVPEPLRIRGGAWAPFKGRAGGYVVVVEVLLLSGDTSARAAAC